MQYTDELSTAEILTAEATLLPDREALAFINVAPVTAVNIGVAVNAFTVDSVAEAVAGQLVGVGQS